MNSTADAYSFYRPDMQLAVPEDRRWYAIHTHARHEKAISVKLQQAGLTTFLPVLTEVHQWSDRRKSVELPLFPCYLFLQILDLYGVRQVLYRTPGVLGLVGDNGRGTPIPNEQIEDVRKVLAQPNLCHEHPFLKAGQRVRVHGGPLDGVEGILIEGRANRHLVISVDTIQKSLAVIIDGYDIRPM